MDILKDIFKNGNDNEIEARLGYYKDNKFNPDIGEEMYTNIMIMLNSGSFVHTREVTEVFFQKNNQRVIKKDDTYVKQTKKRLSNNTFSIKNCPIAFRVSCSQESEPKKSRAARAYIQKILKERDSFIYNMWSFDLTKITCNNEITYQFELEYKYDLVQHLENLSIKNETYIPESMLLILKDVINCKYKLKKMDIRSF